MKVKDLIELLKQEDPEALVICQRDPEGNGYSPLSSLYEFGYVAENTWSGYAKLRELTPELIEEGFTEEDVDEDSEKAVFLVPVN